MQPGRPTIAILLALAAPVAPLRQAAAQAGDTQAGDTQANVITIDGRVVSGRLSAGVDLMIVRDGVRDVYLSSAIVRKTGPLRQAGSTVEYVLNEDVVKCPKKGKVAPVVENTVWSSPRDDGTIHVSLTDPKLGRIAYNMAIRRITPTVCHLEGIEYEHRLAFPTRSLARAAVPIVMRSVDATDPASLLLAARFFREYGDRQRARDYLRALKRLAPKSKDADAELALLDLSAVVARFRAAQTLARGGRRREAAKIMADLSLPPGTAAVAPREAKAIARLKADLAAETAALATAARLLREGGVEVPDLTGPEAIRLVRILRPGQADAPKLAGKYYPYLVKRWAEPFAGVQPTAAALDEAIALGGRIAAFFASGRVEEAAGIASALVRSKLPAELKLALLAHARAYKPPEWPVRWEKRFYLHPQAREKYHYYVQLPPGYRADRPWPVLLALHGQTTTAEVTRDSWGRLAAENGIILISPEYVYGRSHGYYFGAQEHHAVLGALWDAAGSYNIDMDRVYLTGVSQGGTACWDIGSGQSERFAGVVPILGVEYMKHTYFNFLNTAVYAVDGGEDGPVAPKSNRNMVRWMASAGCDATYVEYVGRGHEGFSEEYAAIIDWMLSHRRNVAPARVHLVATRSCDCRSKWIRVPVPRPPLQHRRDVSGRPCAIVKAGFANNTFTIEASGVARLQVLLMPGMVSFDRPVAVFVNGKQALSRRFRPDWLLALREAHTTRDRQALYLGQVNISVPAARTSR